MAGGWRSAPRADGASCGGDADAVLRDGLRHGSGCWIHPAAHRCERRHCRDRRRPSAGAKVREALRARFDYEKHACRTFPMKVRLPERGTGATAANNSGATEISQPWGTRGASIEVDAKVGFGSRRARKCDASIYRPLVALSRHPCVANKPLCANHRKSRRACWPAIGLGE